jgi:ubiquinone/menaquinone biosynthesis C-methylase UbiE
VQVSGDSSRQTWLGREYARRFRDPAHETFHGGGYSNFGFWTRSTAVGTQGDALVDRLLQLVPSAGGRILDVACGQGGTTRRLAFRFPASGVTAVNLFHDQLQAARHRAPGCSFARMDAARLGFLGESFDVVICVEAAFHFETREEFLRESWRVLKPGGHLILSDILVAGASVEIPDANVVSRAGYERLLQDAGFPEPQVVSCRDQTWVAFQRRYFWNLVKILDWDGAFHWWRRSAQRDRGIVDYLLVAARKPREGRRGRPARQGSASFCGGRCGSSADGPAHRPMEAAGSALIVQDEGHHHVHLV